MPSFMPLAAMAWSRRADDAVVPMPRTLAALLAGAFAIALNIGALAAADLVPLATAHGGLLRLLVVLSGDALPIPAGRRGAHAVLCSLGRPLRAFARWTYIAPCLTEVRYAPDSLKVR